MGHFGNGEWNDPCGPVFRKDMTWHPPVVGGNVVNGTNVPIVENDAATEAAVPTSYFVERTGLYVALAETHVDSTASQPNAQVFTIGVKYTDDTGVKYITLTSDIYHDASGQGEFDSTMLTTVPFEALGGTTITFWYTTSINSPVGETPTTFDLHLLVRAI